MSVYITIYFRTIINIFLIPSVPFFDNPFLRSLNRYTLVRQLFLSRMKLQLALPPSRPMSNVTLKGKSISRHAEFERGKNLDYRYLWKKWKLHTCAHVQWGMSTHLRGTCPGIMWPWWKLKSDSRLVFAPTLFPPWFYDEITHDPLLKFKLTPLGNVQVSYVRNFVLEYLLGGFDVYRGRVLKRETFK